MVEELMTVKKFLGPSKAPGPNGIPDKSLKAAIITNSGMFWSAMQRCLNERIYGKDNVWSCKS